MSVGEPDPTHTEPNLVCIYVKNFLSVFYIEHLRYCFSFIGIYSLHETQYGEIRIACTLF